jgi:hypothetical protein
MQIHEVTAPGSFGAQAGVFGRSLAQGITQALLPGANTGGTSAAPTSDPRAAAAAASEPVLRQQAEALVKMWNGAVTDQMKQAGVSAPDQLSSSQKQTLARNLMNNLNQSLLQNRFGNDFKSLPRWVDQRSQPQAQRVMRGIEQGLANILNWRNQPRSLKDQQQQWYDLAKAANEAVRLVTFNPNQATASFQATRAQRPGATVKEPPKITVAPTGQYRLGDQVLDPRNPSDAAVIAKIQAATQT